MWFMVLYLSPLLLSIILTVVQSRSVGTRREVVATLIGGSFGYWAGLTPLAWSQLQSAPELRVGVLAAVAVTLSVQQLIIRHTPQRV